MTIEYFLGYLVLACVAAYLTWRNNFKSRQAIASADFRAAFTDAIFNLTEIDIPSSEVVNVFRVQHLAAIKSFRYFIPWHNRQTFDKATENYRQCCDKCLEGGIFNIAASESTDYAKANRKVLLDSIYDLLSYSNHA